MINVAVGVKHDIHPPSIVEPVVWQNLLGVIWRRGERMIPWRTGRKGDWSLNDRIEEIYLDDFSRREIIRVTGKAAEYQVKRERVKSPKTLERERQLTEHSNITVRPIH